MMRKYKESVSFFKIKKITFLSWFLLGLFIESFCLCIFAMTACFAVLLLFSIISPHHKWNGTRSLLPETECISYVMSRRMSEDVRFRRLGLQEKSLKLHEMKGKFVTSDQSFNDWSRKLKENQ